MVNPLASGSGVCPKVTHPPTPVLAEDLCFLMGRDLLQELPVSSFRTRMGPTLHVSFRLIRILSLWQQRFAIRTPSQSSVPITSWDLLFGRRTESKQMVWRRTLLL